jgi:hypothetical protein
LAHLLGYHHNWLEVGLNSVKLRQISEAYVKRGLKSIEALEYFYID